MELPVKSVAPDTSQAQAGARSDEAQPSSQSQAVAAYPSGISPFLNTPTVATPDTLAFMFLRRDQIIPVYLSADPSAVEHTRFGSFPHSTLVGRPWGSQILSSHVKGATTFTKRSKLVKQQVNALAGAKRKRADGESDRDDPQTGQERDSQATAATQTGKSLEITQSTSGFIHLLPPTPETWTLSLPHRTQVVYTPDYSYVLSRLRVRPGSRLIEAGAGSGSFTHAASRAVFSGYPGDDHQRLVGGKKMKRPGRVFSYEFHEPRAKQLQVELIAHGMDRLVTLTHRDVYQDGFSILPCVEGESVPEQPLADAVFLDLPNPWLALPHLTRSARPCPLNPKRAVNICTFSPCIEQVTKTADKMRELGYIDVSMVEIAHRNIEVRRDRYGEGATRDAGSAPRNVDEAVGRLLELNEDRDRAHQSQVRKKTEANGETHKDGQASAPRRDKRAQSGKQAGPNEGAISHRSEIELKTHTSYLVFAVIPRDWTAADEAKAAKRWAKKAPAVHA